MKSKFRAIFRQIVIFTAAVVIIGLWQSRHLPSGEAPSFPVTSLAGEPSLLPARGEVSVLYFFAPWCGVCRLSMPNLDDLQRYFSTVPVKAVALDFEDPEEVRNFAADIKLDAPVYLGDESVRKLWKINAYPTYLVIDAKGKISGASIGYSSQFGMILRVLWAKISS